MNTYDLFNSLKGTWKISRTVNGNGMMHGSAQFIQIQPDVLFYRESGIFTRENNLQTFNVYREYLYCYRDNTIYVFFAEGDQLGALLHKLHFVTNENDTNSIKAVARHICKNDCYSAEYLFSIDKIHLQYQVDGPGKNYIITTIFDRSHSIESAFGLCHSNANAVGLQEYRFF